jgi:acyl dehydratase
MRTQEFGQRICHGLLGLAVESGLGTRAMPPYGAVAFLGIQEWYFVNQYL